MALQKQIVDLPLVGGINQKEDAILTQRPTRMTNCVYRKSGAVSKRYGMTCIGLYNKRSDGTTPGACELLATYKGELLRIGVGKLDTYQSLNGTSDWIYRDRVSECIVSSSGLVAPGVSSTAVANTSVAYANGYLIAAYVTVAGSTYTLSADVVNVTTGARVHSRYSVATNTTGIWCPRVMATSTTAAVFWGDSTTPSIKGVFLNLTTMAWGTTATVSTGMTANGVKTFDADVVSATEWAFVHDLAAGTNRMTVASVSPTISGGAFTVVHAAAHPVVGTAVIGCMSLRYTASRLWVAYSQAASVTSGSVGAYTTFLSFGDYIFTSFVDGATDFTSYVGYTLNITSGPDSGTSFVIPTTVSPATTITTSVVSSDVSPTVHTGITWTITGTPVKVATLTAAFVNETAPFTAIGFGTGDTIENVGIESTAATTCIVAATDTTQRTMCWNEATSAGTLSYASGRRVQRAFLLSRPFVRSGRAYALVANVHSQDSTQFLIDLHYAESLPSNNSPHMASAILPRQMPSLASAYPRAKTVSNWVNVATDQYVTVSVVTGQTAYSYTTVLLTVKFDTQWKRTCAETCSLLTIGGGVVSGYDGSGVFEYGFAYEPDTSLTTSLSHGTGGSMTSSVIYGYKFVYAWTDGQGNIHRSIPSQAQTVTMGASDTRVDGVIQTIGLTNKSSSVDIEIYRTYTTLGVMGSEYHYVSSVRNTCNGFGSVSFTDTASDTSIASAESIYTTGSVLERSIPSGAAIVMTWKGAILLAGTDDDSVWVTPPIVAGVGPWFNDTLTVPPFEGGAVTAMSTLDSTITILKSDGIWLLEGDPPTDLGVTNIGDPRRVQTDVGCTDLSSVVVTDSGIMFKARTGLYLLNRSLQTVPIGKPVEDSYSTSGFAGAVSLPGQGLVRFLQKDVTNSALNLDSYHSGLLGVSVWSKDGYSDPANATTTSYPLACAMWGGSFVWISPSGHLYQESSSSFLDISGSTTYWVTLDFETAVEKVAGPQAYQRIWYVAVLGQKITDHALTITLSTDLGTETKSYTQDEINLLSGLPKEKLRGHVAQQKCQWMSVRVTDFTPNAGIGSGEGMTLRAIGLEAGVKGRFGRVASANRK